MSDRSAVRIELWGEGDLPLLQKLMGDPAMTEHLGGPESDEKIAERQGRYERLADSGKGRMFMRCNDWRLDLFGSMSTDGSTSA